MLSWCSSISVVLQEFHHWVVQTRVTLSGLDAPVWKLNYLNSVPRGRGEGREATERVKRTVVFCSAGVLWQEKRTGDEGRMHLPQLSILIQLPMTVYPYFVCFLFLLRVLLKGRVSQNL